MFTERIVNTSHLFTIPCVIYKGQAIDGIYSFSAATRALNNPNVELPLRRVWISDRYCVCGKLLFLGHGFIQYAAVFIQNFLPVENFFWAQRFLN